MNVKKKDGRIVPFDKERIYNAIVKSMSETVKGVDFILANAIAEAVEYKVSNRGVISTDTIHDATEELLMESSRKDVAKQYILYRQSRKKAKKSEFKLLDDDFISQYKHRVSHFQPLGEFVFYRTYSRYLKDESRREYWWETARRAIEYNCSLAPTKKEEAQKLFDNMFNLKQFISGRTLWVGGTEVSKKHMMANFNCAFHAVEDHNSFVELLYLLMLGTGAGVRVIDEDMDKVPPVRTDYTLIHEEYVPLKKSMRSEMTSLQFRGDMAIITIGDSKNGWTDGLKHYLTIIFEPQYDDIKTIVFNYNSVRPMGEKLRTFGGTASGHGALKDIFIKIDKVFKKYAGKTKVKIKAIDALDICNIIGEGVVVGGKLKYASN